MLTPARRHALAVAPAVLAIGVGLFNWAVPDVGAALATQCGVWRTELLTSDVTRIRAARVAAAADLAAGRITLAAAAAQVQAAGVIPGEPPLDHRTAAVRVIEFATIDDIDTPLGRERYARLAAEFRALFPGDDLS